MRARSNQDELEAGPGSLPTVDPIHLMLPTLRLSPTIVGDGESGDGLLTEGKPPPLSRRPSASRPKMGCTAVWTQLPCLPNDQVQCPSRLPSLATSR